MQTIAQDPEGKELFEMQYCPNRKGRPGERRGLAAVTLLPEGNILPLKRRTMTTT